MLLEKYRLVALQLALKIYTGNSFLEPCNFPGVKLRSGEVATGEFPEESCERMLFLVESEMDSRSCLMKLLSISVQSLFSAIEIEGSAGKGCCEKVYILSGIGFEDAPAECRGFSPVDSEAFIYKDCCDLWETVDEVIRSSAEAHVINAGARERWVMFLCWWDCVSQDRVYI
jgi:hypothetical protein